MLPKKKQFRYGLLHSTLAKLIPAYETYTWNLSDDCLTGHVLSVADFALLVEGFDDEGGNYCSGEENFGKTNVWGVEPITIAIAKM